MSFLVLMQYEYHLSMQFLLLTSELISFFPVCPILLLISISLSAMQSVIRNKQRERERQYEKMMYH